VSAAVPATSPSADGSGAGPLAALDGVSADVLMARAYLSRVAEPGSLAVAAFVAAHGSVDAARLIRRGQVPSGVDSATCARRESTDASADLEAADRHRIRLLVPESPHWPHFAFAPLYVAEQRRLQSWQAGLTTARYGGEPTVPLALWVRGALSVSGLGLGSAALVGARAATAYGAHLASDLGYGLAIAEVVVVSGGAFGIDAAAHKGALAAGGQTVLVSAGGLDRPYPVAHAALFEQVADSGLLVSESPPGAAPQKHRFLSRNRLIAAFGTGTVVVEAALRSGALNTAAHCVALGRPLMAVPGPVTSAMSAGCHALIRRENDPARLVTSVADVLDIVGRCGSPSLGDPVDPADPSGLAPRPRGYDDLDPRSRAVLDGMSARAWIGADQLAARSGVAVIEVIRALPVLGMAGLIDSGREGYRLRPETGR
jgi:DNA processing protein